MRTLGVVDSSIANVFLPATKFQCVRGGFLKFLRKCKNQVALILTLAVYCGVTFALKIPCPIKFLTGISCPGCGMSRACLSALCLDFEQAFSYHPLWIFLLPTLTALIILDAKENRAAIKVILTISAIALFAVWVFRTCLGLL